VRTNVSNGPERATAGRTRPNAWEYITYCYGRRLPDSMRDWVRQDLAGKGAVRRMMTRMFIPAFLVLAPFWLIDTTLYVKFSMTMPILVWAVLFSHALNKVWRRHMLRMHNLDPNLVDEIRRQKTAHIDRAYIAKYGPRPADAQSNSSAV